MDADQMKRIPNQLLNNQLRTLLVKKDYFFLLVNFGLRPET